MSNSDKISEKNYKKLAKEMEIILDNIPGLVFYKDDKNNLIRVNKYFADAHKTTKEALAGKNCLDVSPKDVAQKYFDDDLEVIKSKKPKLNFIEPWDVAEGKKWVNSNKIPLYDDDGKCIGIIGFSTDVTKQVKAEQKLKQAHEQLNTIFSNLKDTVFVISEDYKILFKNDTAHDLFGTNLIGKDCYKVIKGQDQPCKQCSMKKFAETDMCQARFEQCINTPFIQKTKIFDIIATPIEDYNGQPAILEVFRDNTERVKFEAEIRKLSAYNRNLIEASLDPLLTIGLVGKIMDVNFATETITGHSREELIGTEFSLYFTEPEKASEGHKKVFKTGSVQDYELGLQHVDGHVTPVLYNASIFKDENGNILGVFAAARDITESKLTEKKLKEYSVKLEDMVEQMTLSLQKQMEEIQLRKKAEQKLKQAHEQLDTIFSNLKDTVFVISEDYKILFKNETAHDIFGTDLIGKRCYEIINDFNLPCEHCPMKIFEESDLCQVRFEQCVNAPLLKGERVFEIISSPIERYSGQPAMVEILRDITERKKIEEELKKKNSV